MTTFALLLGFALLAIIGSLAIFAAGLRMATQPATEDSPPRLPRREIVAGVLFLAASLVQVTVAVVLNAR